MVVCTLVCAHLYVHTCMQELYSHVAQHAQLSNYRPLLCMCTVQTERGIMAQHITAGIRISFDDSQLHNFH